MDPHFRQWGPSGHLHLQMDLCAVSSSGISLWSSKSESCSLAGSLGTKETSPDFIPLILLESGRLFCEGLRVLRVIETYEDGVRLFECLNDEEVQRLEASLPFALEW